MTGAARHRVATPFEPLLSAVCAGMADWPDVSVYLYGSVATGQAQVGRSDVDAALLGRRVPRKTLLAVAGLVSVATSTWTTDRARAAHAQGRRRPDLAKDLSALLSWPLGDGIPDRDRVAAVLRSGGVIEQVTQEFAETVGLWPESERPGNGEVSVA